jgi:hypothetical protein
MTMYQYKRRRKRPDWLRRPAESPIALFPKRNQPRSETEHLHPSEAKVKIEHRCNSTYRYALVTWTLQPYIIQQEMKANCITVVL